MTSRRRLTGRSKWSIPIDAEPQTELVAQDAARLAANCELELQMSDSTPGRPPVFAPQLIHFNSCQHPGDDFKHPPDTADARAAGFTYATETCWTNNHDYDLLVRTVLLSIQHHLDDARIMPPGTLGERQWKDAFDLYHRTFPERNIPALIGWPAEVEHHVEEMEEKQRRKQEMEDANPQPCSICEAAIARAEGRTPAYELELEQTTPMPTFLIHHRERRAAKQAEQGDSEHATQ